MSLSACSGDKVNAPGLSSPYLAADDFVLFDLPRRFKLDLDVLQTRWKQLQQQIHPDRFAVQSSQSQRLATQWSVRVNEAYQRLKQPIARAAYLCELAGFSIEAHSNTQMPADFLMQQMQWREALEEAQDAQAVIALRGNLRLAHEREMRSCENAIDELKNWPAAVESVRRLLFLQRFEMDVDRHLDRWDD